MRLLQRSPSGRAAAQSRMFNEPKKQSPYPVMNRPKGDHHLNHQADRGFTLVEMLLVLVILSTLAAVIYPNVSKHGLRARITATKTQIEGLRTALSQFEMDNDRYPQWRNGLLELVQRPRDAKNWRGPYWKKGGPQGRVVATISFTNVPASIAQSPTTSFQPGRMALRERGRYRKLAAGQLAAKRLALIEPGLSSESSWRCRPTTSATYPGCSYSAGVLLPWPATNRWFNSG